MVRCVRINTDATMTEVELEEVKFVGEYELIEKHETLYFDIFIYGSKEYEYPFNMYEFALTTPRGAAYVVCRDNAENYVDISIEEFKDFYEECEDLDDTLLNDELDYKEDTEYDYTDGFIVRD